MTSSRFLAFATAGLIVAACAIPIVPPAPAPAAAPVPGRYGATESRIFELINAERKRRGLSALAYNAQLGQMAKIQSQNMAYFQRMAHVIPEAKLPTMTDRARHVGYPFGRLAENIALGFPDAQAAVQGWMNSKGHRANILNSDVSETGIGIARSSAGGLYYTQVFGRRISSL